MRHGLTSALALLLALALTAACASEEEQSHAAQPLLAEGTLDTTIDGKAVSVSYAKAKVEARLVHRLAAEGDTCIPEVDLTIARADGTCRLDLVFRADFSGVVKLQEAHFHAVVGVYQDDGGKKTLIDLLPCEGWTDEPKKTDVVIYDMVGGEAKVVMPSLGQPSANLANAAIPGIFLQPTGKVKMKYLGRQFETSLDTLRIKGDARSTGSAEATCEATYLPLPKWKAKDIQPKSAGFGSTYGLEQWKGKRVAIVLVQGKCGSCIAQVEIMESLRKKLEGQGRDDFVMVAANNIGFTTPELQKDITDRCEYPVFQDMPDAKIWATQGGKKNDAWVYNHDGTEMLFFQGSAAPAVNTSDFQSKVEAALTAK